jgi:2-(1,2-epoxy-1,2-dihydrophenyl)acetyl-CoA isomerase
VSGGRSDGAVVEVSDRAGVRTVRLAEPERRNALSIRMRSQLLEAVEEAMTDAACRCLVLRGSGGHFCAGGDLRELADVAGAPERLRILNRLVEAIVIGPTPVVAVVEGAASGSGLALALACDVVVAAESAVLTPGFTRVGLAADGGITWTLPRRVGDGRARSMLLAGRSVRAPEAGVLGLADEVCPGEDVDATADRIAAGLAAGPAAALRALKAPRPGDRQSLRTALTRELEDQLALMSTDDFAEGLTAVGERRAPAFGAG